MLLLLETEFNKNNSSVLQCINFRISIKRLKYKEVLYKR